MTVLKACTPSLAIAYIQLYWLRSHTLGTNNCPASKPTPALKYRHGWLASQVSSALAVPLRRLHQLGAPRDAQEEHELDVGQQRRGYGCCGQGCGWGTPRGQQWCASPVKACYAISRTWHGLQCCSSNKCAWQWLCFWPKQLWGCRCQEWSNHRWAHTRIDARAWEG